MSDENISVGDIYLKGIGDHDGAPLHDAAAGTHA
ncbi:Uncharacterised protein [Mycobacteroides abscessus subsp. abscessus]|nr:Uncharacterised protein [Mycobacteroides abscessus subsp. abscessus]